MFRPKPQSLSLFDRAIVARRAIVDSFRKLAPQHVAKNPVMFVVEVGSVLTTLICRPRPRSTAPRPRAALVHRRGHRLALVHGAVRELRRGGRRGARQGAGRHAAQDAQGDHGAPPASTAAGKRGERSPSSSLRKGDLVVVEAGQLIPGDGEIIEGIASVDESAITGESAPVIRESGGDRSAVTGGTKVLSDRIVVRIVADPGRVVPRPHDRAGRRRRAAEDAQRDRAAHPAGRADAHLPVRLRDAGAARACTPASRCRRRRSSRCWSA